MDRYKQYNKTKITDSRKKVFKTIIYPKIERSIEDIYIDIISEDRLDNLAYQYYKDVTLWWIIAEANKIGKGTMIIAPGQRIRIPNPDRTSGIIQELYNIQQARL